jgi:hypothetical protein
VTFHCQFAQQSRQYFFHLDNDVADYLPGIAQVTEIRLPEGLNATGLSGRLVIQRLCALQRDD